MSGRARVATVAQLMHRDVLTVPATMLVADALALMHAERVRHAIVLDGAAIAGVVSDRDITRARPRMGTSWLVHDVMSAPAVVVAPTTAVSEAAHILRSRRIGCLPVVHGGALVGIVTRSDLLGLVESGWAPHGGRPARGAADVARPVRCAYSLREKWP